LRSWRNPTRKMLRRLRTRSAGSSIVNSSRAALVDRRLCRWRGHGVDIAFQGGIGSCDSGATRSRRLGPADIVASGRGT
jgi:hypothetical protein